MSFGGRCLVRLNISVRLSPIKNHQRETGRQEAILNWQEQMPAATDGLQMRPRDRA